MSKYNARKTTVSLVLPYPPSANNYWQIARNRLIKTDEARTYNNDVTSLLNQLDIECFDGNVRVIAHVYRPRKSGDLDNRLKVLLDSLEGHVYKNDKQITAIHAYRHDDKNNPRVEIEISPRME